MWQLGGRYYFFHCHYEFHSGNKYRTSLLGLLCFASFCLAILNTKDQLLGNKCNNNPPPPPPCFAALIDPYPSSMTMLFNQLPQHTVGLQHIAWFGWFGHL
jgi:hypothetical protein